ncbi:16S rRNA (uracil1498-N3)-methyltransferase [Thermotomaculum hydrothermale]|uniref:Ribosomal RNA small subunit methyltransferase E n=1 Tax=Thermotomaculum hydrothermale TaxID=981385 RepID=A0A7R6PWS5_9BACT|nr:RsmE family RNA methyltransferase [Thermotomaculum hydrothermale]BBB32075.1 16S rRNA (uracil1498-N3)-methyltransferase [Thermotomaculum hydrothermale]
MQLRRVFADKIEGNIVKLNRDESHYVTKVLRLKECAKLEVILPQGVVNGEIVKIDKGIVFVEVEGKPEIKNEPETKIALFQAMPEKLEKLELIVQKATELGVSEIYTFHSRYTNPKYRKMNLDKKFERLEKIAREAVRQCKRTFPPEIFKPVKLPQAIEKAKSFDNRFIFGEKGGTVKKDVKNGSFAFFIGAEGGFSEEEFDLFIQEGFYFINLSGRILRTETAAITGLVIIQTLFGDYSKFI